MTNDLETLRLLIIDDDEVDRMAVYRALKRTSLSFDWAEASDGATGLSHLLHDSFDCVFLDFQLPQESGLHVLIQTRSAGVATPIIMLTGRGDEKTAVQLMKAGASDYIPKGEMSPDALARSLRHVTQIHQAQKQKEAAEAALRQYTAELEIRNQELDAFAHTVAHDLKTPLAVIIGYGEMILQQAEQLSPQEQQRLIGRLLKNGKRMETIILELLLLATIRKEEVKPTALDMDSILSAARYRLEHTIEHSEAKITLPSSWPIALGYGPWIEEVWFNYLSNAIKYGGQPPQIELGATPQNGVIRFWVRDNGPGINEENQTKLFIPFTRFDQVRTEGQGLGLSIVQSIVTKLNGAVGVESESGSGSTFWFTLPAQTQPF